MEADFCSLFFSFFICAFVFENKKYVRKYLILFWKEKYCKIKVENDIYIWYFYPKKLGMLYMLADFSFQEWVSEDFSGRKSQMNPLYSLSMTQHWCLMKLYQSNIEIFSYHLQSIIHFLYLGAATKCLARYSTNPFQINLIKSNYWIKVFYIIYISPITNMIFVNFYNNYIKNYLKNIFFNWRHKNMQWQHKNWFFFWKKGVLYYFHFVKYSDFLNQNLKC